MSKSLDLQAAHRHLEATVPRYLEHLATMVNIDSGTYDKPGVDAVGAVLREAYVRLGLTIDLYPNPTYGDSFVASLRGNGSGRVLLLGHMDTVYPLGTAEERPFRIDRERAIGPGVADMKAGDLAIVYALEAVLEQSFDNFGEIRVVHNSDEEVGSPSSRELIRMESERADAVLVLEAGRENGNIVSARKGIVAGRVAVRGLAAHAGVNHDRGRSAALELANIVVGLESANGRVPGATLNVGRMEAGERTNVVPDRGFAEFEIRAFEMGHLEAMMALAREAIERRTVEGTEVELDLSFEHYPMHKSEATARLVGLAQSIAGQLGFEIGDTATGGASDGNTAASAGRPVLDGLGPIGGSAHSPSEWLDLTSIAPRAALLSGLIASIAAGRGLR